MNVKQLLMMLVLPLAALLSVTAVAQNSVITGKVTDSKDGSPIAGVSVLAKGTTYGTQTGTDGAFRLSAPAGTKTLVISYIGYATQEVAAGSGEINVSLVQGNGTLNEVVV